MRNSFGDYRSKMQEEQRRMSANVGRVQFQAGSTGVKSQFLRKAMFKETGEEFRFNFQVEGLTLSDSPAPGPAEVPASVPAANIFKHAPSDNAFRFNFANKDDL